MWAKGRPKTSTSYDHIKIIKSDGEYKLEDVYSSETNSKICMRKLNLFTRTGYENKKYFDLYCYGENNLEFDGHKYYYKSMDVRKYFFSIKNLN